ncbi:MAG: ECF transporter S component [Bacilli bacterium]
MKTNEIVRTGILTAIVFVSMSLLHVNIFNSSLHLGSLVIVIMSLTFKRKEAAFASSVGATLFDIFSGYLIYAPFTFVARLLLSLIVSYSKDKKIYLQVVYALVGGVIVIIIYFISYLLIIGGLETSLYASIPDVIQLILTILGVFIAIPLKKLVEKKL